MMKVDRKQLSGKEERLRREFLPEALELIEKPASPWGHVGILLICFTVAGMFLWAVIGKTDVTVTARGRLSAGGESGLQTVQAETGGRIERIHVREGDRVQEGEVLLEIASETEKEAGQLSEEQGRESRYREHLIRRLQQGKDLGKLEKFEGEELAEVFEYMQTFQNQYEEKKKGIRLEIESAGEELRELCEEISVLQEEESDYRELWKAGAVSQSEWMEKKNALQKQRQMKETTRKRQKTLRHSMDDVKSEYESELASMRLACREEIRESEASASQSERAYESRFLKAPVSGVVKSLLVNTEGGVVAATEKVAEIVPEEKEHTMELNVRNQDIGYIRMGQSVSVKFDTYDYQEYGKIQGTVSYISPDAFQDEHLGEVYLVRVSLPDEQFAGTYGQEAWRAGIQGTAEIKTGERRIIHFFIEPIREHLDGSLHTP